MTRFDRVRFKNILSVGETWVELDLSTHNSSMIIGDNGVGKSSIMEAIFFGCFGRSYRGLNLDRLVNRKNKKGMEVELWMTCGRDSVFVRRTLYPDNFEVVVNGSMLPQVAKRKYQKILNGFIGCDWTTASHLIFIGKGKHQPFMKLDRYDRRNFVENVANLVLFGKMNQVVSSRFSKQKQVVSEIKAALASAKDKLKVRKKYLDDLAGIQRQSIESEKKSIQEKIDSFKRDLVEKNKEINNFVIPTYDPFELEMETDEYMRRGSELAGYKAELRSTKASLTKLEKGVCSECGTVFEGHSHDEAIKNTRGKIDELESIIMSHESETSSCSERVRALNSLKAAHEAASNQLAVMKEVREGVIRQILRCEKEYESISSSGRFEAEIEETKLQISELDSITEKLSEKLENEIKNESGLKVLQGVLSDSGLKASILSQIVPVLNEKVNQRLTQLGLFASFTLDENFNDTIKVMGFDEAPYAAFSEGEKLRIDLAVLLAWKDIARLVGSFDTNLIFFDEIFDSSLDADGAEALADLLNASENTNVFVITHTPEKIADRMDRVISVKKLDGYTKVQTI